MSIDKDDYSDISDEVEIHHTRSNGSSPYSDNSSASFGVFSFSTDNPKSRESDTDKDLAHLNKLTLPSSLKFRARNFLFPYEKPETRVLAREDEKKKIKSSRKKVRFNELTRFLCYDAEKYPFENYKDWIRFCDVYLLCGHYYKQFVNVFIENVSQTIVSDEERASKYWRNVMRKGFPALFTLENLDGALNHASILGSHKAGTLPLLPDITEEDLIDPEKEKRSSKRSSRRTDHSQGNNGLTSNLRLSNNSHESDESVPKNIYKQLSSRETLPLKRRLGIKEKTDLVGLKRLEKTFSREFVEKSTENFTNKITADREDIDILELSERVVEILKESSSEEDSQLFSNKLFCKVLARSITCRHKIQAFSELKLTRYFRKAFACPILNPTDKDYSKDSFYRGKDALKAMFDRLNAVCQLFQEVEEMLKLNYAKTKETLANGITDLCEWNNFARIVVANKDQDTCRDFFSGSEFKFLDKDRDTSRLKLIKLMSRGKRVKSKRKKKKAKKELNIDLPKNGQVFKSPDIVLPGYFAKIHGFMRDPMRTWGALKVRWMEIYLSIINTGIITAVLNDNLALLKHVERIKYPKMITETSLISAEPLFFTGKPKNKEAQRTQGVYKVWRKGPIAGERNYVSGYHYYLSYFAKGEKDSTNVLTQKNYKNFVNTDTLSVLLNPVVRADLFLSRRRHVCDVKCSGHKGMLLATAIRLGCFDVMDYVISKGISLDKRLCSGDVRSMRWDLPPVARQRETAKNQKQHLSKLRKANQSLAKIKTMFNSSKKQLSVISDEEKSEGSLPDVDPVQNLEADEVSMKKGNSLLSEQEQQKINEAEKEKIMKQREAKPNIFRAPSFEQPVKEVFDLKDVTSMNDFKKNTLVSRFYQLTPLTIAVESAVADPYISKKGTSQKKFRKLSLFRKSEKELFDEQEKILTQKRVALVDKLLKGGVPVLHCNASALRACLPVIEGFAAAAKKQQVKAKKAKKNALKDASHINNMTMTARDVNQLKKRNKNMKRFSIAENVMSVRKAFVQKQILPTSTEALTFENFEEDTFKVYNSVSGRHDTEKRKRFAVALAGIRTLNKVSQAAVLELETHKKRHSNKFGGNYAALVVRTILVHEAARQQSWDTIRFLCPYKINEEITAKLETKYDELDTYETSFKVFDKFTGEVLKQTIKLLLKDLEDPYRATAERSLRGIYFILREYNLTLPKTIMYSLFACLNNSFTQTDDLRPGVKKVVGDILTLKQVQVFLALSTCTLYEQRVIDSYAITKTKESYKILKFLKDFMPRKGLDLADFKEHLFIYAIGANLQNVAITLRDEFTRRASAKSLRTLIFHCIVKKQKPSLLATLESICQQTSLNSKVYTGYFQDALACSMSVGRSSTVKSIEAGVVLHLLKNKIVPTNRNDCFNFLVKSLTEPLFDLEECYKGEDRCADLSRYFALNELFDLLFLKTSIIPGDEAIEFFTSVLQAVYNCASDGAVWLQGVEYFIQNFRSLHEMVSEANDPKSALSGLLKILNERTKWEMEYSFDKKMLIMSRIDNRKQYSQLEYEEAVVLDDHNGRTLSALL